LLKHQERPKDIVPKLYQEFRDVFGKESFNELPDQKQWDHTIELIPDAQMFSTKVYTLAPVKHKQLDEFLNENLKSWCICPSNSPMASPVFFMKRKMGASVLSRIIRAQCYDHEDFIPPPTDPRYPQ